MTEEHQEIENVHPKNASKPNIDILFKSKAETS